MAIAPASRPVPAAARRLALFAALLTVCLWASAFVGIRYAGRELGPGPLALARLLVGSAALGVMMLIRRPPMVGRPGLPGVIVCGVLWFGAYNVALNAAEQRVDAGTASLLVNVAPLFIAILAGVALKEGIGRLLVVGCIVSFSGVALIAVGTSRHGLNAGWGAALCIVAAAVYAVGVVAQKPALRYGSPLAITWLACTIGVLCCLPYAPAMVPQIGHASPAALEWTVYLGLVPTAIGFSTWAYALARPPTGQAGPPRPCRWPIASRLPFAWCRL
jgi:drug/metabolite transporter (DMT)-like permease